jgi:hypothetical protein
VAGRVLNMNVEGMDVRQDVREMDVSDEMTTYG